MSSKKSVLITGCSAGGLGDALARAFHAKGFRVFATARNPKKMAHFADLGIETVILDVQSKKSIDAAVQEVSQLTGGTLDILVNNSGVAYMMPILDVDMSKASDCFDLNVMSVISMTQGFFPLLRKAAPGSMVVNNTSIAGVLSMPMQGVYSASKAAAASVTDALRLEIAPFGIKVVDLKTGSIISNIWDNQGQALNNDSWTKLPANSVYSPAREPVENAINGKEIMAGATKSDVWASQVVEQLTKTSPPTQIWRGAHSYLIWFFSTFLPHGAMNSQARKMTGLDVFEEKLKHEKKTT